MDTDFYRDNGPISEVDFETYEDERFRKHPAPRPNNLEPNLENQDSSPEINTDTFERITQTLRGIETKSIDQIPVEITYFEKNNGP